MARGDIRGLVKRHPVASFFVLTYAISWLAWLPAMLGYRGGADTALSMIAQFGPALAALAIVFYTALRSAVGPVRSSAGAPRLGGMPSRSGCLRR